MTLQQALEAAETAMKFADGHVIIEAEASQKLLRVSMLTPLLANALRMSVKPEKPPTWAVFIQETLKRAEKEGI